MTAVRILPADESDVPFLAAEGARMFAQSHSEAMQPEDLEAYLEIAFDADRIRRHLSRPDNVFLVAHVDGQRVGYARLMETEPSPLVSGPEPIELRRLYVQSAWHGRGVATALMSDVLASAAARGRSTCWLHVWEHNARAIRFYEREGFTSAGKEGSPFRSSNPIAHVMVRSVP